MFIGEYSHSLDDKGRVNMPAKFRRDVREGVVVTRGLDNCLFVYPRDAWQAMAERLTSLPLSQKNSRDFSRLMLAGAWDAELDSQGRIMLPEYLRTYASLKKHVAITGLGNRIEIWDEDSWNQYKVETEKESQAIAESMAELGI